MNEPGCRGLIEENYVYGDDGSMVYHSEALAGEGCPPYFCPYCNSQIITRGGPYVRSHLAHLSSVSGGGAPEGKLHKRAIQHIFQGLIDERGDWRTGVPSTNHFIPDISGVLNCRVGIEVQKSKQALPTLVKRSRKYADAKVGVLWVFPLERPVNEGATRKVSAFERYLHAFYFGRIYYWWDGLGARVMPVHFEPAYRFKSEYYDVDTGSEYGGEFVRSSGSAVMRPCPDGPISIQKSFAVRNRGASTIALRNRSYEIPECLLVFDTLRPWW
jgi:competence protein CoiA